MNVEQAIPLAPPAESIEREYASMDTADFDTESSPEQERLINCRRHPIFVTLIGLLPAAMFWAMASPIVKYTTEAVNAFIENLRF